MYNIGIDLGGTNIAAGIVDENGQILSSSSSGGIYKDFSSYTKISSENYKTLTETDRQFFSVDGTDTLFICKSYPDLNWNVINLIPLESLTLDHMVILHNILLISIVVFILSVFFSILCTGTVTAPIQKLVEKMKSASAGKLNISASYSSNDELAVLYNQFNLMMQKIQTLLNDIYEEQNAKQKMEVRLLQSQINPHFLYNTLDSIMWMIEAEQYDDAVSMVQALGRLFRISLSKGKNIITVGDELQHARSYLDIQKYRYKNKFVSCFEIEEGIEKYKTIKLIIQPLIENAIYYGMEYMDGDGEITIRAYTRRSDLFIEVEDNGLGMPEEQVERLLTDDTRIRSKGSGIGLRNVHQRIQLYFGKAYGLKIISEPDQGTIVRIHLPKTEEVKAPGEVEA